MGGGRLLRTMRSLTLIKNDVGRGAGGPWLSNHSHPSLPHHREPVRSMLGVPSISPNSSMENQKN